MQGLALCTRSFSHSQWSTSFACIVPGLSHTFGLFGQNSSKEQATEKSRTISVGSIKNDAKFEMFGAIYVKYCLAFC